MWMRRLQLGRHLHAGRPAAHHQDGVCLLDLQNGAPVSRMTSLDVGVATVTTTHLLDQVAVGLDGGLQ